MSAGESQARLPGMASLFADGVQHQRTAGDGFGMPIGVGQAHEQTPPVVDQGGDPSKLGVGGASTVRGYRENLLVRDRGFVGSIEFRFPVFRLPLPFITKDPEDGQVQLATFYDFGWSENVEESSPNPRTISSVGVGVRWDPHPKIHGELYWAMLFATSINTEEEGLQDDGIHFALDVRLF